MSDIYDKIRDGCYENNTPYPEKPKRPPLLDVKAGSLTGEQIASLAKIRDNYEWACDEYKKKCAEREVHAGKLIEKFWADLFAEHEMDADCPFVQRMKWLAYSRGHSGGFQDVVSVFEEMVELYDLYKAKK